MSTNVTTIFNAMNTRLAAVLTSANRLAVPSTPEFEPLLILRNGFGVRIGDAQNTDLFVDGNISFKRRFIVTLTREAVALQLDAASRGQAELDLAEDAMLVIKDFMTDASLNNAGNIPMTKYESDNGINEIVADASEGIYLVIDMIFETQYFETLP